MLRSVLRGGGVCGTFTNLGARSNDTACSISRWEVIMPCAWRRKTYRGPTCSCCLVWNDTAKKNIVKGKIQGAQCWMMFLISQDARSGDFPPDRGSVGHSLGKCSKVHPIQCTYASRGGGESVSECMWCPIGGYFSAVCSDSGSGQLMTVGVY